MSDECCACRSVGYDPRKYDDGTKCDRWVCTSCGGEFERKRPDPFPKSRAVFEQVPTGEIRARAELNDLMSISFFEAKEEAVNTLPEPRPGHLWVEEASGPLLRENNNDTIGIRFTFRFKQEEIPDDMDWRQLARLTEHGLAVLPEKL